MFGTRFRQSALFDMLLTTCETDKQMLPLQLVLLSGDWIKMIYYDGLKILNAVSLFLWEEQRKRPYGLIILLWTLLTAAGSQYHMVNHWAISIWERWW